jgi:hypothetical protein
MSNRKVTLYTDRPISVRFLIMQCIIKKHEGGERVGEALCYTRKLRVRFPMRSLDFFLIVLILPAALCPWPQALTEMSTRNLPGDKGRPASA